MPKLKAVVNFLFITLPIIALSQPIDTRDSVKTTVPEKLTVDMERWDQMYLHLFNNIQELGANDEEVGRAALATEDDKNTAGRLMEMSANSPINFAYNNKVQAFIDMYLGRKRELTERMLGLSAFYYPEIEESLDKYGLPLELKHLVAVESAFNPTARSHAGATGLWQFMYGTGKMYDLKVSSYTDDRKDPKLATEAACRFLRDLYKMYGNWELALAAYNSGPGTVNKAIRYSGGKKNYWRIYRYLPRETRGYVPAFIAVNYIFTHAKELGVKSVKPDMAFDHMMDTIHIDKPWDLKAAAETLDVDYNVLKLLNPRLKTDHIPYYRDPYVLNVPYESAILYATHRDRIKELEKEKLLAEKSEAEKQKSEEKHTTNSSEKAKVAGVHKVRKGENLTLIAKLYGCSILDLKQANGLYSSRLDIGQVLNIPASSSEGKKNNAVAQNTRPKGNHNYRYYTIQPGDTIWDIVQKHENLTISKIKQLNNIRDVRRIKPGQKIAIGVI